MTDMKNRFVKDIPLNVPAEDVLSDEDKKTIKKYKIVWSLVVIAALIIILLPSFLHFA